MTRQMPPEDVAAFWKKLIADTEWTPEERVRRRAQAKADDILARAKADAEAVIQEGKRRAAAAKALLKQEGRRAQRAIQVAHVKRLATEWREFSVLRRDAVASPTCSLMGGHELIAVQTIPFWEMEPLTIAQELEDRFDGL